MMPLCSCSSLHLEFTVTVYFMFVLSICNTKKCGLTTSEEMAFSSVTISNIGIKFCQVRCDADCFSSNFVFINASLTCPQSSEESKAVEKASGSGARPKKVEKAGGSGVRPKRIEKASGSGVRPKEVEKAGGSRVRPKRIEKAGGSGVRPKEVEKVGGSGVRPKRIKKAGGSGVHPKEVEKAGGSRVRPKRIEKAGGSRVRPKKVEKAGGSSILPKNHPHKLDTESGKAVFINATQTPSRGNARKALIFRRACSESTVAQVKHIFTSGDVNVNSRGEHGRTPLMFAVLRRHNIDMVEYLVSKGADMSLVDDNGNTILHLACEGRGKKIVKFVLSQGKVDIYARNRNGKTAVDIAKELRRKRVYNLIKSHMTI